MRKEGFVIDLTIGWRPYETTFMGEKITMELRPLKSWAFYEIIPYLDNPNPRRKDETNEECMKRLSPAEIEGLRNSSKELHLLSAKIFPEHVRNIENLVVNGMPVTPDIIAEESIFMGLAIEISGQLGVITSITENESKNLKGPSDTRKSTKKKAA